MSSGSQTSSSVAVPPHHIGGPLLPQFNPNYAVNAMRALASVIDTLAATISEGDTSSLPCAAINQILTIQRALADGRTALKTHIPNHILRDGGEHPHFIATIRRPEGHWIKDTYDLMEGIEERIRQGYREQLDFVVLRNELFTVDSPKALSLPRLMRAFAKSASFTSLHLNSPTHRATLGIASDFSKPNLNRYLANYSNNVWR